MGSVRAIIGQGIPPRQLPMPVSVWPLPFKRHPLRRILPWNGTCAQDGRPWRVWWPGRRRIRVSAVQIRLWTLPRYDALPRRVWHSHPWHSNGHRKSVHHHRNCSHCRHYQTTKNQSMHTIQCNWSTTEHKLNTSEIQDSWKDTTEITYHTVLPYLISSYPFCCIAYHTVLPCLISSYLFYCIPNHTVPPCLISSYPFYCIPYHTAGLLVSR